MIDGIGWAGKGDACVQAVEQLFSLSSRRAKTERVCAKVRERKERERGRIESEGRAEGGRREREQACLPRALQADQVSTAPR